MNETPQELDANIMKAEAFSSEAALPTSRREELYPGDTGALPFDVRRLLIALLRGPYLDRSDDKRLWRVLIENTDLVRSRLADLFLDLLIDEGTGIAFCRKAELGELQAPSLLPTVRLKFLDSALLLELRERLMRAAESGERAVVTLSELRDLLRVYDRASLSNDAALEKHLSGNFFVAVVNASDLEMPVVLPCDCHLQKIILLVDIMFPDLRLVCRQFPYGQCSEIVQAVHVFHCLAANPVGFFRQYIQPVLRKREYRDHDFRPCG